MARRRNVSEAEKKLLDLAMKDVKPLRRIKVASAPPKKTANKPAPAKPKRATTKAASPPPPAAPAKKPKPPPATSIDRRTEQKLKRGRMEIEAKLDLHGLRQADAHKRLGRFIADSVAQGRKAVIVITGKGSTRRTDEVEGFMPSERSGVLREAVPKWLAQKPLADLVWGVKEAGPRHGGAGALYVLLRKPKRN
jgi:DNA-nicking Smr family endonuclease